MKTQLVKTLKRNATKTLTQLCRTLICLSCFIFALPSVAASQTEARFSISFTKAHGDQPIDGRLLLLLSNDSSSEPRMQVSESPRTQMVFGMDVEAMRPGQAVIVDQSAFGYPIRNLRDVPAGEYYVQAVLHRYETFHRADGHTVKLPMDRGEGQHWNIAPGNLYSSPRAPSGSQLLCIQQSLIDKDYPMGLKPVQDFSTMYVEILINFYLTEE